MTCCSVIGHEMECVLYVMFSLSQSFSVQVSVCSKGRSYLWCVAAMFALRKRHLMVAGKFHQCWDYNHLSASLTSTSSTSSTSPVLVHGCYGHFDCCANTSVRCTRDTTVNGPVGESVTPNPWKPWKGLHAQNLREMNEMHKWGLKWWTWIPISRMSHLKEVWQDQSLLY